MVLTSIQLTIVIVLYVVIAVVIAALIWLVIRYVQKAKRNQAELEELRQNQKAP